MDQSQAGKLFGRLIEFARPHKTSYIVSVVLLCWELLLWVSSPILQQPE